MNTKLFTLTTCNTISLATLIHSFTRYETRSQPSSSRILPNNLDCTVLMLLGKRFPRHFLSGLCEGVFGKRHPSLPLFQTGIAQLSRYLSYYEMFCTRS